MIRGSQIYKGQRHATRETLKKYGTEKWAGTVEDVSVTWVYYCISVARSFHNAAYAEACITVCIDWMQTLHIKVESCMLTLALNTCGVTSMLLRHNILSVPTAHARLRCMFDWYGQKMLMYDGHAEVPVPGEACWGSG